MSTKLAKRLENMKLIDVMKHYGDVTTIHKEIGVTRQCISVWKVRGYIPLVSQYRIQELTNGKLVASLLDTKQAQGYKKGYQRKKDNT